MAQWRRQPGVPRERLSTCQLSWNTCVCGEAPRNNVTRTVQKLRGNDAQWNACQIPTFNELGGEGKGKASSMHRSSRKKRHGPTQRPHNRHRLVQRGEGNEWEYIYQCKNCIVYTVHYMFICGLTTERSAISNGKEQHINKPPFLFVWEKRGDICWGFRWDVREIMQ